MAMDFIGGAPSFSFSSNPTARLDSTGARWGFDSSGWTVNLGGSGQTFNAGSSSPSSSNWQPLLIAGAVVALLLLSRR